MKKLFSLIITMVFVFSLSVSPVFGAEADYEKISNDVNKTNEKIEQMINKAKEDANKLQEKVDISGEPNDKFDAKLDEIKTNLINDTNEVATKTKEKGADEGFLVICEWVEVEIGGAIIKIDPLRIAGY
jgi:peptidoglycan hydrolase CwlO-like protein